MLWEAPSTARGFERLASFSRLVLFDRRGTGLSDPVERPPTLEQQMDDLQAVMDAVGIERGALCGGGARGAEFDTPEVGSTVLDAIARQWGDGTLLPVFVPSQVGNRQFEEWWARYQRGAVSPGMGRRIVEMQA